VHYLLRLEGLTISVAESCTGGAISKALISYTGAFGAHIYKLNTDSEYRQSIEKENQRQKQAEDLIKYPYM